MLKKSTVTFLLILMVFTPMSAGAVTAEADLKSQIEAKTKDLEAVSQQIQQTQGSLDQTAAKSKTLKQEVDSIDKNLKAVTLGIRQSEILLDKFGLEIKSLSQQMAENEQALVDKKDVIAEIFANLQAQDNESLLIAFLNNKSLSDSMIEAQSLADLNGELLIQLADIRELKTQLLNQQNQIAQKKNSTEIERSTLKAKQSIAEDQKTDRAALLAKTKNQEKLYQLQLDELAAKQQAISDEIAAVEDSLRVSYDPSQVPGKRAGVFRNPLDNPRQTQAYGATEFAKKNGKFYPSGKHNGMDFAAPLGTPIYAAADGTVTLSGKIGYTSRGKFVYLYYGEFVLLKHANNLSTIYGHMSRRAASNGQVVKKGDIIGYVGKTGFSTGYHVHFGVFVTNSIKMNNVSGAGVIPAGYTLNPADYL